jgi:hypothetical protein
VSAQYGPGSRATARLALTPPARGNWPRTPTRAAYACNENSCCRRPALSLKTDPFSKQRSLGWDAPGAVTTFFVHFRSSIAWSEFLQPQAVPLMTITSLLGTITEAQSSGSSETRLARRPRRPKCFEILHRYFPYRCRFPERPNHFNMTRCGPRFRNATGSTGPHHSRGQFRHPTIPSQQALRPVKALSSTDRRESSEVSSPPKRLLSNL